MSVLVRRLRGNRQVVGEVYADLRGLVESIARRFSAAYRTDFQETLANANLFFLEAYHGYDPSRGTSLEQRVQYCVRAKLLDRLRADIGRYQEKPRQEWVDYDIAGYDPDPWDADEFARDSGLGRDARTVIGLLLDTPAELLSAIRGDTTQPGPASIREQLRRYLFDAVGWSASRVAETFAELRGALS